MPMSRKNSVAEPVDKIHGDRRFNRRYSIPLSHHWQAIWRRKVEASGVGTTINLSSGGILFAAHEALPAGRQVELAIVWPAFVDGFPRIQLVVSGIVVRSEQGRSAIRTTRHEFRTVAAAHQNCAETIGRGKIQSILSGTAQQRA